VSRHPDEEYESEGVRISDKRRIDPDTFEVREVRQPEAPAGEPAPAGDAKVAELTADLQRITAEYANYRKRVERDRELIREMAVGNVLSDLLPILDDVDRAREHGELEGAFRVVGESLESIATKIGLERFGTAGDPFNPAEYEALTSEPDPEITEPTVARVLQPGYRFAGRVLRPARVSVAGTD
jgi:molecular chaperone GrpE